MILWGDTPVGSTASIYLPGADAAEIIDWAASMSLSRRLTMIDAHTIACPVGGVTYLPVPQGQGANLAGLLSIDLAEGIRNGQEFRIVVRQVTGVRATSAALVRGQDATDAAFGGDVDRQERTDVRWRRSLGIFALTIPVGTKHALLAEEMRALSIFRLVEQAIPIESRWYPVFRRFSDQLVGRVSGMGGDPHKVGATSDGDWEHRGSHADDHWRSDKYGQDDGPDDQHVLVGKIIGLMYDRFGDFTGFTLETEACRTHEVCSTERKVEELVRIAWRERSTITIGVVGGHDCCLVSMTVGHRRSKCCDQD